MLGSHGFKDAVLTTIALTYLGGFFVFLVVWYGNRVVRFFSQPVSVHFKEGSRSPQQQDLKTSIATRFPPSVLFRVPAVVAEKFNDKSFLENPVDPRWIAMLKRYPNPPQTERERTRREAQFWGAAMQHFLRRESDGTVGLAPRGDIQNLFNDDELWIFRWYYAATGEVIRPHHFEMSYMIVRFYALLDEYKATNVDSIRSGISAERHAIDQKMVDFAHNVRPAFREKWGGWFRNGINSAFEREYEKKEPSKNIYGEGGFASLSEILRAKADATSHPAAGQTFKD